MSKHLTKCRRFDCPGCGPESETEQLRTELKTEIEGSHKEYNRGQKYKQQRNAFQEEVNVLTTKLKAVEAELVHWKGQAEQWQDQFCNMTKIRDQFVKERDHYRSLLEQNE